MVVVVGARAAIQQGETAAEACACGGDKITPTTLGATSAWSGADRGGECSAVHTHAVPQERLCPAGKEVHWVEFGVGGGTSPTGDRKAATAQEAAYTPFFGWEGRGSRAAEGCLESRPLATGLPPA